VIKLFLFTNCSLSHGFINRSIVLSGDKTHIMLHWWFTQMSLQAHYFPFLYKYDCSISSLSVSNPIGKDKPRAPTRTFRELRRDEICNGTFVFLWCRQTFTCTTNRKHFCLKQHFIALKTQCILHNFSLGKLSGKRDIYICIYIYIYICI